MQPPQQIKQIIGITAHQGAGQTDDFAHTSCQHAHRLPLGGAVVLILVPFINHHQAEIVFWQIALDEFGRLIAALTKRELGFAQRPIQARCLAVAEDKITVIVHQIGKRLNIVFQKIGQHLFTKLRHQLFSCFWADGR